MWIDMLHGVIMALTKASTWKKSAKWKRLIKQLQNRLIIQRNRRESIRRQSSADIAQLLQNDQLQKALDRVKQLYKDKCLLAAYDQIEHICGCIATNLPLFISKQSTLDVLPDDVSEAVSSLVFAASRCGELPELNLMRNLLRKRFGCKFEVANVELFKENLVNSKMKQNLCIGSIPDDVKLKLIKEIAEEHNLQLGFQDFEQKISPKCQKVAGVSDVEIPDSFNANGDNRIQTSQHKASEKKAPNCSISNTIDFGTIPGNSQTVRNSTNCSSSCNQVQKNEVQMKKLQAFTHRNSTTGSISCYQVKKNEVQMKKQEAFTPALSSTPKPVLPEAHHRCHSLPRSNPWSQDKSKDLINDRRSLDSSIAKLKEQRCSSHVHPKLPDYEDVVAKLTELKLEKQRQSVRVLNPNR
ncbi:hypothetical protein Ddye_026934 [Dipteronia dyeriana]|uniref:IST1-like protein n=1 Tax=Dipteronia dyeriana TaxID=168575 RepID=A0AAD9TP35_9ROSI|nr:hypothetical protein Ddye_026934 [Dipteronia dyeriana]